MSHVCCFTGYRPHRFAFSADGLCPEQVARALGRQIAVLYDEGCRVFITGMCAGVDLWAAEAVLSFQQAHPEVELWAAVPFRGQESRWSVPIQAVYRRVLDACQRVEVLYDEKAAQTDPAACYRGRNHWMVDQADTVLAVYALEDTDRRSGTASTVRYARKKQRRILYIHPRTLAVVEETVQQIMFPMD
ncbi:MAG: DUF1273 family protein [Clostridia bacterium]|nr:DUF1273 family protein [Clostridia bacterium]